MRTLVNAAVIVTGHEHEVMMSRPLWFQHPDKGAMSASSPRWPGLDRYALLLMEKLQGGIEALSISRSSRAQLLSASRRV